MAALHCGQVVRVGSSAFQFALRERVLERDVFLFGTATGFLFFRVARHLGWCRGQVVLVLWW